MVFSSLTRPPSSRCSEAQRIRAVVARHAQRRDVAVEDGQQHLALALEIFGERDDAARAA